MDGNLKLIRWGFVIHAAIDGCSRLIAFARVSLNNRADMVIRYFKEAEQEYGKCSRLRCDYGGENIRVGEYMLHDRGLNQGSLLTGSSVRNQCIERVCKDCKDCCVKTLRAQSLNFFLEYLPTWKSILSH